MKISDSIIEKKDHYNRLYDIYKELLTEKQRNYFELYFQNDLTFDEIAEDYEISKAAVHDSITKTINLLDHYENKINVLKKEIFLKQQCNKLMNGEITKEQFVKKIEEEF